MALQSGARFVTAEQIRLEARAARWKDTTSGQAPGFAQANLVVLPAEHAFEFTRFCLANPKPCPIMEVLEVGDPVPHLTAPDADVRTDLPGYRIYRRGELDDEVDDVMLEWRDDSVAFLLGCSFTFEEALTEAGISVRHQELGCTVPMYRTAIRTRPAGIFHGRMVVSMRPIPAGLVSRAIQTTARFPKAHGAPIHVGDPSALGIKDLATPDYGDPVPVESGELPVFWGCGVTPQSVGLDAKPDWMITHSPGRMFVTDVRNTELDVLQGEFLGVEDSSQGPSDA
jgi:uncharacterized protein YcsI (UPF0317 family)